MRGPLALLGGALITLALVPHFVLPLDGVDRPGGDALLMIWNLWNVNEALSHGRNPLYTDLLYYPLGSGLARHTYSPGFWPISFLAKLLSGGDPRYPIYAYRLGIWTSFSLAFGFAYLLFRQLGLDRLVSFVPALLYGFSCFGRWHVAHLQHLSAAFLVPLLAVSALRVYQDPRTTRLLALGFLLGVGVYFGELVIYMWMAVTLAVLLAALSPPTRAALREWLGRPRPLALAASLVVFGLTLAPFVARWLADGGKAPKYSQSVYGSANAAGFVIPDPGTTPLYGRLFRAASARMRGVGGSELFVGFPLLVLAPIALFPKPRASVGITGVVVFLFFLLSLGPELKVGSVNTQLPLPYRALMAVPPFSMGRTPAHCALLAVFGLACLAALGLQRLRDRLASRAGREWGTLLCGALTVWSWLEVHDPEAARPSYRRPPALDRLLPGPVVNVPLSVFDGFAVFMQTFHGQPIVTGWVSRRSPEQLAQVRALEALLDQDAGRFVERIRELGVRNVILGPGTPPETADALMHSRINVVDLQSEASLVQR